MTDTVPTPASPLRIGTRGSPLALAQAHEVRDRLAAAHDLPETAFEIVVIKTTGDRVLDRPLGEIGGKGLFTREIEEALLAGTIDMAVHSMKDMPVEQPEGLVIDCCLEREDPRDALVGEGVRSLDDLAAGEVVGTSSLRRRAQLLARRPDLKVVEFRGNVQTRLGKLADGVARCTFLAMAGLRRLGILDEVPATPIPVEEMLPAVAQGVIGVERRVDDGRAAALLAAIHHPPTWECLVAERAFLRVLDGSCRTPIGGHAVRVGSEILLRGEILRPDGSVRHAHRMRAVPALAEELGEGLGRYLLRLAGPGFFED